MAKRIPKARCPICRAAVKSSDPEFPFCSERCRTIDLGKWASGDYVIRAPLPDTEQEPGPSCGPAHADDE